MHKRLLLFTGVLLLVTGALIDRVITLSGQSSPAAAATTSATTHPVVQYSSAASNLSVDQAAERAYAASSPSVVYVVSQGLGTGSGVIYDSNGDIVTNYHVINGASSITVTLSDGRSFPARVVGTDVADDLAVIKIDASGLTPAHFATAGSYSVAQTVLAIGSPLGLKQTVTEGLISGLHRVEQEPNGSYIANAVQTSAPINPGNSGGALVALDGSVVGIPTLEQTSTTDGTSAQAIGFAIPSERVTLIANQIISNGKVTHTGRAFLGIQPSDSTGQGNGTFGFGGIGGQQQATVTGALVARVESTGPAGRAGVQQGDVITAADGHAVSDAQDLLSVLATKKPGQTIKLDINRNGSTLTVTVKLGELPA